MASDDLARLAELEGNGVLRATDPGDGAEQIQFAHHILFDYAVARLTFDRGMRPAALTARLSADGDRDLALVLRPSLNLVCLDTLADAILDRITHAAHRFDVDGPSLRPPLDDPQGSASKTEAA